MTLHVASLFSGIGLIDLGFHRAAIPTRLLCEAVDLTVHDLFTMGGLA